jgi:hypothetical protein
MRSSHNIAKGVLVAVALAAPPALSAKEVAIKQFFCVPGRNGTWVLQRFKPLIDPRAKTTFAEMSFADHRWLEVRVRRFYPDSEFVFDYKYDATGNLNELLGSIKVFGSWEAEGNLLPDADGTVRPFQVLYYRNHERIRKPDDAAEYLALLNAPPVYRTDQSVPCATQLKEAEKMNATQE